MFLIALRAHRTGLLVTGLVGFVATFAQGSAFVAVAGHTAAERAAFARSVDVLATSAVYLVPLPLRADTLAGYVMWRSYGAMNLVFAIWALFAATGAIRNEEERGRLELWLASGVGRLRLMAARCAAYVVVAAGAVALTGLGALAAGASEHEPVSAGGVVEVSLALLGVTLTCFAIGLLAAQLASTRRSAAALGGVVLLALSLVDALSRVRQSLSSWAWLSPFTLYHHTNAIAPGGAFDVPATVALFATALVIAALAALAFWRRDLGAALAGRRRAPVRRVLTPSTNPLLRVPFLAACWEQRLGQLGWLLGTVVFAAYVISLATAVSGLLSGPAFQGYARANGVSDPKVLLIALIWNSIATLVMAAYAITQVARWVADDAEGRLEMLLAQPLPRWRVIVDRALALTLTSLLLAAAGTLVLAVASPTQGIHLDGRNVIAMGVLLTVLALTFGAVGAAVTAWLPRLAVPVEGVVAGAGFFIQLFGPLFRWPDWALDLSVFRLVGTPLTSGVFWTGLYAMAGVIVAGFALALLAMRTREVGA